MVLLSLCVHITETAIISRGIGTIDQNRILSNFTQTFQVEKIKVKGKVLKKSFTLAAQSESVSSSPPRFMRK